MLQKKLLNRYLSYHPKYRHLRPNCQACLPLIVMYCFHTWVTVRFEILGRNGEACTNLNSRDGKAQKLASNGQSNPLEGFWLEERRRFAYLAPERSRVGEERCSVAGEKSLLSLAEKVLPMSENCTYRLS